MQSVGQILREARVRQGLSLPDVTASTRISLKVLTAIEEDNIHEFSSPFFYKSFVKQFAYFLSVSLESLAEAFEDSLAKVPAPSLAPPPTQEYIPKVASLRGSRHTSGHSAASVAFLVLAFVACSGVYALWKQAGTVESAGDRIARFADGLLSRVAGNKPEASTPDRRKPVEAGAPDAGATPGIATSTAQTRGDRFVVQVSAVESTWLSIAADGAHVFSGTLNASQTKVLEGRDSGQLKTENAAALRVTFNGKRLGPLGPQGEMRTVVFTPTAFTIVGAQAADQTRPVALLSVVKLFSPR